jgi:hypothetical protein
MLLETMPDTPIAIVIHHLLAPTEIFPKPLSQQPQRIDIRHYQCFVEARARKQLLPNRRAKLNKKEDKS